MFIELVMIIDEREKIVETARTQDMRPLRAQTFWICDFDLSPKDFKV